jgi:hypothetical protein
MKHPLAKHNAEPLGPRTESFALELVFEPIAAQISLVREFVERYFQSAVNDPDLLCRMAVAAHELMENAFKYSSGGHSRLRIEIRHDDGADSLLVCVVNLAAPEHISSLKAIVEEISAAEDVDSLYQRYLERAARRKEGSGLGLARIRVEAEMELRLRFQGEATCVEAVARFEPEERK